MPDVIQKDAVVQARALQTFVDLLQRNCVKSLEDKRKFVLACVSCSSRGMASQRTSIDDHDLFNHHTTFWSAPCCQAVLQASNFWRAGRQGSFCQGGSKIEKVLCDVRRRDRTHCVQSQ